MEVLLPSVSHRFSLFVEERCISFTTALARNLARSPRASGSGCVWRALAYSGGTETNARNGRDGRDRCTSGTRGCAGAQVLRRAPPEPDERWAQLPQDPWRNPAPALAPSSDAPRGSANP